MNRRHARFGTAAVKKRRRETKQLNRINILKTLHVTFITAAPSHLTMEHRGRDDRKQVELREKDRFFRASGATTQPEKQKRNVERTPLPNLRLALQSLF